MLKNLLKKIKPQGILSNAGNGILSEGKLEDGFDKKLPDFFPLRSPISNLGGHPEETKVPPPMGFKPKYSEKAMKILMEARKNLNKIYSDGYFENHYPEADKDLKNHLHEQTMSSWTNAMNKEEKAEEAGEENKQITVVININSDKTD